MLYLIYILFNVARPSSKSRVCGRKFMIVGSILLNTEIDFKTAKLKLDIQETKSKRFAHSILYIIFENIQKIRKSTIYLQNFKDLSYGGFNEQKDLHMQFFTKSLKIFNEL